MKPFNLNDFKAGKKVITRDGREVKQLTVFDVRNGNPIRGVVDGEVFGWSIIGEWCSIGNHKLDLFHPDEEITMHCYKGCVTFRENGQIFYKTIEDGTYKLVKVD